MNQHVLTSPDKESTVVIDQGELISYSRWGEELIHQKGDPGWRNADTEMFPIIGPTESKGYLVPTDRGDAPQDQHGLLRELPYRVLNENAQSIEFAKSYEQNATVKNSKFPDKSSQQHVSWPYSFDFFKRLKITNDALSIEFEIRTETDMPFMLGYHPAFKLSGDHSETFKTSEAEMSLQQILDAGAKAYPVLDTDEISLIKLKGYNIKVTTEGFDNFMLWTEVDNMVCIEPITAYPYIGEKLLEKEVFRASQGVDIFKVVIHPYR